MFRQLKMSHKLWLAVSAIVVLLVAVVGFSGYRSASTRVQSEAVIQEVSQRHDAVVQWAGLTDANAIRTLALVLSDEPAVQAEFKDAIAATSAKISEVQKSLEAMPLSDREKAQMDKIAAARKNMAAQRDQARKLKAEGQGEQAVAFVRQSYNPASAAYLQTLQDFVQLEKQIMLETREQLGRDGMTTVKIAAVAVGSVLLAIIIGAYYLIRSIVQPLQQANTLAGRIAEGDLSQRETITRGDEFGELLHSLYAMSDSLGAHGPPGAPEHRQHCHSQCRDLQRATTTCRHEPSKRQATCRKLRPPWSSSPAPSSKAPAARSRPAAWLRGPVGWRGAVARRVVTQVVSTMDAIQHSSQKIADIIGVIDGIAFQTNILALDAAVEAARAGEQGRGFAVVASEVRSLAGRSAEAAKEIKQLIGTSVEKVEAGSRLVQEAGTTMQDIVQSVQRVNDMIGEITAASTEQSAGVAQVNQAVGNLDQMTQQNAALVEESAAAAQSLREQAEQLAQVVSMFKVNASGMPPAAPVQRSTPPGVPAPAAPPRAAPAPAKASCAAVHRPPRHRRRGWLLRRRSGSLPHSRPPPHHGPKRRGR